MFPLLGEYPNFFGSNRAPMVVLFLVNGGKGPQEMAGWEALPRHQKGAVQFLAGG
jgi:hypothetical protein